MSEKSIAKLRAVTYSQCNYDQTVAQNMQQDTQDIIDANFQFATDYMVIEEQSAVGSSTYNNVGARVTHGAQSGLTENFANEIKKIIFQTYNHEQYLGKMYQFSDDYWLTVNLNVITGVSSHSLVRKCNNTLKWVDTSSASGDVISVPCVFTKQFTNTSFNNGTTGVIQIAGDFMVLVQANTQTKKINYNWRFVFDGHTFQVTQIDNHLSDTYLILKLKEIEVQANDDLVNNIANDVNAIPSTSESKILPADAIKILEGNSQSYTVYYYVDGEPSERTFTISGTQAVESAYQLTITDGNNFTVTNLSQSPIPLIVNCIDNISGVTTSITIKLGGSW